jgi:hypothetical protein
MRHGPTSTFQCTYPGCTERGLMEFDNKTDQRKNDRRMREKYRCFRHSKPDEVLSADAPVREAILVNTHLTYESRGDVQPLGLFWVPEGQEHGGNGISYGPGFKAMSKDFPQGTRLIVTARVELPDE